MTEASAVPGGQELAIKDMFSEDGAAMGVLAKYVPPEKLQELTERHRELLRQAEELRGDCVTEVRQGIDNKRAELDRDAELLAQFDSPAPQAAPAGEPVRVTPIKTAPPVISSTNGDGRRKANRGAKDPILKVIGEDGLSRRDIEQSLGEGNLLGRLQGLRKLGLVEAQGSRQNATWVLTPDGHKALVQQVEPDGKPQARTAPKAPTAPPVQKTTGRQTKKATVLSAIVAGDGVTVSELAEEFHRDQDFNPDNEPLQVITTRIAAIVVALKSDGKITATDTRPQRLSARGGIDENLKQDPPKRAIAKSNGPPRKVHVIENEVDLIKQILGKQPGLTASELVEKAKEIGGVELNFSKLLNFLRNSPEFKKDPLAHPSKWSLHNAATPDLDEDDGDDPDEDEDEDDDQGVRDSENLEPEERIEFLKQILVETSGLDIDSLQQQALSQGVQFTRASLWKALKGSACFTQQNGPPTLWLVSKTGSPSGSKPLPQNQDDWELAAFETLKQLGGSAKRQEVVDRFTDRGSKSFGSPPGKMSAHEGINAALTRLRTKRQIMEDGGSCSLNKTAAPTG